MIFIVGTAAPGGINSVIEDHLQSNVYKGYDVKRLITHNGFSKFFDIFLFFKSVIILLVNLTLRKVTLVHAHMSYNASFWRKYIIFSFCKLFNVPFVCHLHGSEFKEYVAKASAMRMTRMTRLAKGSSAFLVLSKSWKNYIDEVFGIDSVVLPNFIDIDEKFKTKKYSGSGDIVFIGAFIARKGILELIEAFYKTELACKLHLCGSGPLLKQAQSLVETYHLGNKVVFHGWVNADVKYDILSKSSVLVLPTYNEGLPLTILEAFATKTFVISTPVGGIPEVVINNSTGFLVPAGEIEILKESMLKFFSNTEKCSELVAEAYSLYENTYTSNKVLPILAGIYKKSCVNLRSGNEDLV